MASHTKARSRFKLGPIPALLAIALVAPGMAQAADDEQTSAVEKITVTGSNIRRADTETPSPVQVITSEDLKRSGFTSVAQVLQNITANGQGTLNQGFSQAFASGASGISLRGLTVAYTLVLIDGHRMAPNALSDDAQRSFVDVSNIPFDAVERIEILKDGASAVYGSDAIAGVVNIILKHSFVGVSITAEGGVATEGGGATTHGSFMYGWGDLEADGYNAYFNVEYRHQDEIDYEQRAGNLWASTNLTSIGGINKTPGAVTPANPQPPTFGTVYITSTNPALTYGQPGSFFFYPGNCTFALQQAERCQYQNPHAQLEPRTQNVNLLGSFTRKLDGDWKVNLQASVFDSQAEQYPAGGLFTYPTSFTPNVAVAAGVNPHIVGTTIPAVTIPANYPGNPLGTTAFVNGVIPGAPNPHTEIDSKAMRVVADLTGTLAGWDFDGSVGHTQDQTVQNVIGLINIPILNQALNSTGINHFNITGGNPQRLMQDIFPSSVAYDNSYLDFGEVHFSRSLAQLAGGDLGFSTGASYVTRQLNSPAPPLIAQGVVGGNNAYVSGGQDNRAVYAEISAPVTKALELDGSIRYDNFNNAESAWTPQIKFKFTPIDIITFRGAIGAGFRAPNAAENGQSGEAFLAGITNDPILCPGGPATATKPIAAGSVISACAFNQVTLQGATADLKPEKSVNATFGVILEPIKGWSTTLDLYEIKIRNEIVPGPAVTADTVRGAPISTFCANGAGGQVPCTPAIGPIIYVPGFYVNANSTTTSGFELTTEYKLKLGSYGSLKLGADWSHTMGYILKQAGVNTQLAGTHGPFIIGGDTGNPRDRFQLNGTWYYGPAEFTTAVNYIGTYNLTDPSFVDFPLTTCGLGAAVGSGFFPNENPPSSYCNVKSFTTVDISLRYHYDKRWTLFGSVTNLFNEQPPIDLNTYGGGQLPFNPSLHEQGAIGRFVNIGATYAF
jgi:iron complex outermembrane receptor protein